MESCGKSIFHFLRNGQTEKNPKNTKKQNPQKPQTNKKGNSLAVQWLGLRTFTAEGPGSIPSQGNKILQAA